MDLNELADTCRVIISLQEKLLECTEEIKDPGRIEALNFCMVALEMKRMAADIHRIAEDMLVAAVGEKTGKHTIDGTVIDVRRSYRRSEWEHSKLATHVALRATGGEMVEGMDEVVDAFIKACRPEWRVGYLKEIGLSDEDYCSRDLGRPTVTVF